MIFFELLPMCTATVAYLNDNNSPQGNDFYPSSTTARTNRIFMRRSIADTSLWRKNAPHPVRVRGFFIADTFHYAAFFSFAHLAR
jgi:hypothetical protein